MVSKALLAFAILFMGLPPAMAKTYCCKDPSGHLVCGDILPPQCLTRPYDEYNSQGVVAKQVAAPLTPEERAQKQAEEALQKKQQRKAAEQARQDRALLASYTTVHDIEAKRDRTLADLRGNLHRAQERYDDALAQLKQLQQRVQSLGKKPIPNSLQLNLSKADTEASINRASVEANQQEITAAQERFQQQIQRFQELTRQQAEAVGGATAPASSSTSR
jgi:hypothetical protein